VTAVKNDSTKMLVLNVVNRHETKDIQTDVVLQTGEFNGSAKVFEINGKITAQGTGRPDPNAPRTEEPVNSVTREKKFKGNTINYSFPAHSLTQLMIPVK
jgi:alpha-N-arabinofuranosidase